MRKSFSIFCFILLISNVFAQDGGLTGYYLNSLLPDDTLFVRNDREINYIHGEFKDMDGDDLSFFKVQWKGYLKPEYSETYTFFIHTIYNGILYINGKEICRGWENEATIELNANEIYTIQLDYNYNNSSGAAAFLMWSSESQPLEIIPHEALTPWDADQPFSEPIAYKTEGDHGLLAEYYASTSFRNEVIRKIEPVIRFVPGVFYHPAHFPEPIGSAVFRGKLIVPETDNYTLYVRAPNQQNLYLNGEKILDDWQEQTTIALEKGVEYDFRMEYKPNFIGIASARLMWSSSTIERQIIPPEYFRQPPKDKGLTASVFANTDFTDLIIEKNSTNINIVPGDFNHLWNINNETFAIEWYGNLALPEPGSYMLRKNCKNCELFLNEALICDSEDATETISFTDEPNQIVLKMFVNNSADTKALLLWKNGNAFELIPDSLFTVDNNLATFVPEYDMYTNGFIGLRGYYYTDNTFNEIIDTKVDATIRFLPGELMQAFPNRDIGAVRWEGTLKALYTGSHKLMIESDGLVGLTINDQEFEKSQNITTELNLSENETYPVKIDYEITGNSNGEIYMFWEYDTTKKQVIPKQQFKPAKNVLAMETLHKSLVHCYPNPFNNTLFLSLHQKMQYPVDIAVYHISGKCVMKHSVEAADSCSGVMQIQFPENVPSGMYFLSILTENKSESIKLMKQ